MKRTFLACALTLTQFACAQEPQQSVQILDHMNAVQKREKISEKGRKFMAHLDKLMILYSIRYNEPDQARQVLSEARYFSKKEYNQMQRLVSHLVRRNRR